MFSERFVVRVTRAGEESTAGADEVIVWFFSRQSPVATRSARTLAAAACVPFPLLPPPPHALPLRCRASGSLASERASERAGERASAQAKERAGICDDVPRATCVSACPRVHPGCPPAGGEFGAKLRTRIAFRRLSFYPFAHSDF